MTTPRDTPTPTTEPSESSERARLVDLLMAAVLGLTAEDVERYDGVVCFVVRWRVADQLAQLAETHDDSELSELLQLAAMTLDPGRLELLRTELAERLQALAQSLCAHSLLTPAGVCKQCSTQLPPEQLPS